MPPVALVVVAIASVQVGAALSKSLFDEIGPGGTVLVRVAAAALVLCLVWRPSIAGRSRRELGLILPFACVLAGMNLAFYAALERLPLGIVVTFEFVGPLGVAVLGSRKPLDLAWVGLAAAGILLLSDFGTADLDGVGVALALTAGAFWGAYILLTARVGQAFPGGSGLSLAMLLAVIPLAPIGIADGGSELLVPSVLLRGSRGGHSLLRDPASARAGGAAPPADRRLRRADEPGAGGCRSRRLRRARRRPGHPRGGRDHAGGGRKRRRGSRRHAWRRAMPDVECYAPVGVAVGSVPVLPGSGPAGWTRTMSSVVRGAPHPEQNAKRAGTASTTSEHA